MSNLNSTKSDDLDLTKLEEIFNKAGRDIEAYEFALNFIHSDKKQLENFKQQLAERYEDFKKSLKEGGFCDKDDFRKLNTKLSKKDINTIKYFINKFINILF